MRCSSNIQQQYPIALISSPTAIIFIIQMQSWEEYPPVSPKKQAATS